MSFKWVNSVSFNKRTCNIDIQFIEKEETLPAAVKGTVVSENPPRPREQNLSYFEHIINTGMTILIQTYLSHVYGAKRLSPHGITRSKWKQITINTWDVEIHIRYG